MFEWIHRGDVMRFIVSLIGLLLFCVPVQAVTVDFNAVSDEGAFEFLYAEKGVVSFASGGVLAHKIGNPGSVHMTDGGTGYASSISFVASGLFNAVQFDIDGVNNYCTDFSCTSAEAFDNVKVVGERDGIVVASSSFYSEEYARTHIFGGDFVNLDRLTISVLMPGNIINSTCMLQSPCSFFDIDNLVLDYADVTTVPLPAGLPLYGAGIGILALMARRRKKARN